MLPYCGSLLITKGLKLKIVYAMEDFPPAAVGGTTISAQEIASELGRKNLLHRNQPS